MAYSISEADLADVAEQREADLTEMSEWSYDEWAANACCPDAVTAARRWCGCGGSGALPAWVRRTWDANSEY
jgi:hypothetical protein